MSIALGVATLGVLAPVHGLDDSPRQTPRERGRAALESVAQWTFPAIDVERLVREDDEARTRPGIPRRIGFPQKTELSPASSGTWEERKDGGRTWRLRLHAPGALWMVVGLETFRLPAGARLFAYDPARQSVLGPFTHDDVRHHGQLWFPPIDGSTVVLELEWPAAHRDLDPALRVGTVSHGYKAWSGVDGHDAGSSGDASGAGPCNVDVNCPLGAEWQAAKRGVVQLLSGGYAFCTGTLVNTTANDCRPYVLTAAHCGAGPSTTFRFNYERPGCESGSPAPGATTTGASVVASYSGSDFALLELDHAVPQSFDAHFNGWRRSGTTPFSSWCIHHPLGDVKKISFNNDPLSPGQHWGASHWRVTDWEIGTTEGGSSGSPLFDSNRRIVGQLHGGTASCSSRGWDEYGRLAVSWTGGGTSSTRLADWLDPSGTATTTLDGIDAAACHRPQPDLSISEVLVDDSLGNGDGVVDPGETIALRVRLANDGDLTASEVLATLSVSSPLVAVIGAQAGWPAIAAGAGELSAEPALSFRVDPAWDCGRAIAALLEVSAAEAPGAWSLPVDLPTGTSVLTPVLSTDVENGPDGFTVQTPIGLAPWTAVAARSSSPVRSWFAADPAAAGETVLVMPTVGGLPGFAELRFEHFVNSEAGFDGGVLEYSTDAVSWQDAGSLIVEGGYNGVIGPTQASALTGRQAWTGDLGGWRTVSVDLSSLAGQNLALRWRFASDASLGDEGWYVDDMALTRREAECTPPAPAPPGEPSAPGTSAAPLLIGVVDRLYALSWSPPESGGPVVEYLLYSVPLAAPASAAHCAAKLGAGTTATLGDLPDGRGFLVVARNASGVGPLGSDSSGAPRPDPGTPACP